MVRVAGNQYWLTPWTARYFEVPQNSGKLTVEPLGDLSPTAADPLRLIATVFEVNDTPPDEMQRSLASLALVAGISGEVTLANGAVVNLATGAVVGIQGTPSVAVSNSPTVALAGGSSVSINGTPNVSIQGNVSLAAGSSVAISGTPTVAFAAGQSVSISGTPNVAISSGNVAISSGTVNVQNTPNGVVSTFVKSPPAIGTVTSANVNPAKLKFPSGALGNLGIMVISLLINTINANASATITITVPSNFTLLTPKTVSIGNSPTSGTICWVFVGILTEFDITTGTPLSVATTNCTNVGLQGSSFSFGSGGNNAFSNQSLTGMLYGATPWSSAGASNSNLTLPSSSPGLIIAPVGCANTTAGPTLSIGTEYYPPVAGTGGLVMASNMTGAFSISSSANPDNYNNYTPNVQGEYGAVIPQ